MMNDDSHEIIFGYSADMRPTEVILHSASIRRQHQLIQEDTNPFRAISSIVIPNGAPSNMIRKVHQLAIFLLLCLFIYFYRASVQAPPLSSYHGLDTTSLFLTEGQCTSAFPGLFNEIERGRKGEKFTLKRLPDDTPGLVQGRIRDGKVALPPNGVINRLLTDW